MVTQTETGKILQKVAFWGLKNQTKPQKHHSKSPFLSSLL